ncbi:transcriptional repressor LexA [Arenimonas sp.]|uniref:transcriptional repressor LexA n=1 Tax=Arenimonas sp. TaxID=1872635 RepID=UPI0039E46979
MPLTARQQAVLDFVASRIREHGSAPTLAEIAEAFGFSQARSAQQHLQALEAKGHLRLLPGKARGIRLTRAIPDAADLLALPILGRVAAGRPIGADAPTDAYVEGQRLYDRATFFPQPDYLLRVKGDSMIGDGILDGDLIAVKRMPVAESGQIVVARVDGEITVKRLQRTKTGIRLLPRNPDHAPIEIPRDADFAIEGLYCGLVRSA